MANEFVEGSNRITVEIVDRENNKVGPGPLLTCLGLTYTAVLSGAGDFSARFPANDPRLDYLQLKKHFLDFYVDGELICYGLAENWTWELDNAGQQILAVSGRDSFAELEETTIDTTAVYDGPDPLENAPTVVVIAYNSLAGGEPWSSYPFIGLVTETLVYGRFTGETALGALRRIAERTGEAFCLAIDSEVTLDPRRTIKWLGTATASTGVRAVQGAGDPIDAEGNPHICFIQRLTERRDATRMISKVYPYGSGLGDTRLDLAGTSRVAPAGFTLNTAQNSITSDSAESYIGKSVARHVNFKDIRPIFNTDADIQTAKDYLFDAALAYLKRNDSVDDVVEYDIDVLQLPRHARVGMTIHVTYQDDRRDLDLDFVILAIRTVVGSSGERTYSITVSLINQWRFNETNANVSQMEEGEIFAAHPQIDASSYWMTFREEIGDDQIDHIAEFPFVLSEEVLTIRQVLVRYKVDRLLSAVGEVSYASPDTALGGATTTGATAAGTTDSGGSGTSGTTAAGDTVSGGSGTSGATAPGTTDSTGSGTSGATAAGTSDSGGSGTSGVSSGNTGTAVGNTGATDPGATSSTAPDTLTDTNFGGLDTATQAADGPGSHWHDMSGHQHDFAHTHGHNTHTHSMNSHDHSLNSHTHSTPAHTHATSATHTHTTPNHTHTTAATHTHSTPAHIHSITATHTHSTPAHTHIITATHTHTMATHTHAAPALVTTYTLRRTPALNSYVMADLEYSVNGGAWLSLDTGVPVSGGYYLLDITADIQNPAGLKRPYQQDNLVQVRRKTAAGTGKTAMIRSQIGIRQTIQSVVVYS